MQLVASTRLSLASTQRNPHDDDTCTTRRHISASLEARLKNSNSTYFHVKQTTRSWRVSHAVLPKSILWRNR
jgi:hypothetical protein